MKIFVSIMFAIILFILCSSVYGYYQWYDDKGFVHYSNDMPPENAKNKDGSSWYETGVEQEVEKDLTYEPILDDDPLPDQEHFSQKPVTEKPEVTDNEGLFTRLCKLFSDDEKTEDCNSPWLVEKHGICPVGEDEPNMNKIGSEFKAVVLDKRKGVWSSCRGTHNGDIITFTYKGQGYWETNGNVPECAFYQGFYWK